MLGDELPQVLKSLCEEGACYFSSSDTENPDGLDGSVFLHPYYPPQRHWNHVEMIRLVHGEMALYVNGTWTRLTDGRVRVFLAGTEHTEHYLTPDRPYVLLWLVVVPGGINIYHTGYSPESGYFSSGSRIRLGSPMAENLWRCASDVSPSRPRFHYLLMESLDHTIRNRTSSIDGGNYRADVLQEIKEYLDEYYWKQLSMGELGAMTHFSPPYLNRLFRERYQCSLHDYLTRVRLERAAKMLREELSLSIGRIAAAVGIPDQRYFSRCFRRKFSMTPGEYRAEKLQGKPSQSTGFSGRNNSGK